MFKKRDIIIISVLILLTAVSIALFILTRQQLKIGDTVAKIDNSTKKIFVSLPEGSSTTQKIYFNFPFKNNSVSIKKISSGGNNNPSDTEEINLQSGAPFDFESFIFHSKVIVKSGSFSVEYDMWVTTGDVPILLIDAGQNIEDEPKSDCKISILSGKYRQNIGLADSEIELTDIAGDAEKYSYSLNIKENNITGDVPRLLDLEVSKRFSLSALYPDSSCLRQKIAYDLFESFSENNVTPESRFVELYLNGEYQGVYLLSKRVDRQMLSISGYDKKDTEHSVIYEASGKEADFTNQTEGFSQIEPDYENDGPYLKPLEELIDFIASADTETFLEKVNEIIDIDNLVDNHILFLLSGSANELASNQYIYRDNQDKSKFKFCPGDYYNYSFGIDKKNISPTDVFYPTTLYNRLYEDEAYRDMLKDRWNYLKKEILTADNAYKMIETNELLLKDCSDRDSKKWYLKSAEYSGDIKYIKNFIKERITWLDSFINNPPILKIGEAYAFINEKNSTIFCSLPVNSTTKQKISWEFDDGTRIYLEPLSCGKYINFKNDFDKYEDMTESGRNNSNIIINLDSPLEGDSISVKEEIHGWVLNPELKNPSGIDKILVFDGPLKTKENFLGAADIDIEYNSDQSYKYSKFNLLIDTLFLENGNHELYIYTYDNEGNYSIFSRQFQVSHYSNKVFKLKEVTTTRLSNGEIHDFREFIYHGIMTIKNNNNEKQYDFYLTTSDTPIVIIKSENDYIPVNTKINAGMQVIYNDSNEKNYINASVFDFDGEIGIEMRGASTLRFPKKQYSIETRNKYDNDENASLLGMPAEADWILIAPYSDKSLIRIPLAFNLSNQIGLYAPRTKFVEVFLDNGKDQIMVEDYKGLYILTEKIKKDKDRVDIESLFSDDEDLLSGGYLLEMVPSSHSDTNESVIETVMNEHYIIKYPNKNKITQKQKEWITDYMSSFERALFGESFKDKKEGYLKYIDIDSFIDYIIINELFKNNDIFYRSTFISKDRNGKLKLGPVWDFDLSAGNITQDPNDPINLPGGFGFLKRRICNRLFLDMYFTDKYIARWKELREDVLNDDNIKDTINLTIAELSVAQIRNFQRWQILGIPVWPGPPPYNKTYKEEVEKLERWLLVRAEWIDNNIDSLHHEMVCADVFINDNNCFEFTFFYTYDDNNWVKIYDMNGNEVFSLDIPPEIQNFEACLSDGTYTVKTFHDSFDKPIQEFVIGKP